MNASVKRLPNIAPAANFTALGDDSQHSHTEDKAVLFIREDLPADVLLMRQSGANGQCVACSRRWHGT